MLLQRVGRMSVVVDPTTDRPCIALEYLFNIRMTVMIYM